MSGRHRWADTRDARRFRDATGVDRHLNLSCFCPLIECCHNEDTDQGDRWRILAGVVACGGGTHAHSGSPASGFTQPWAPGDESWRAS
jgi:hypothetical protein